MGTALTITTHAKICSNYERPRQDVASRIARSRASLALPLSRSLRRKRGYVAPLEVAGLTLLIGSLRPLGAGARPPLHIFAGLTRCLPKLRRD